MIQDCNTCQSCTRRVIENALCDYWKTMEFGDGRPRKILENGTEMFYEHISRHLGVHLYKNIVQTYNLG